MAFYARPIREASPVHCPFCRNPDTRVADSRAAEDGSAIRRRRVCSGCDRKFTTIEQVVLHVVKRSGVLEPFSREKVIRGVSKACQGRPVTADQLAALGQRVEERLRAAGLAEIPSEQVGIAILGPLAQLDSVAYLRFASVYKNFECVDDFAEEIAKLRGGDADASVASTSKQVAEPSEASAQEPLIG